MVDTAEEMQPLNMRMRLFRNKRGVALAVAGALIALLFAGLLQKTPERQIDRFVDAAGNSDAATMLSLVSAEEITRLGLTPAKFALALSDAAGSVEGVAFDNPRVVPVNARQGRFNRVIEVELTTRGGTPLKDSEGSQLRVQIYAYNTDQGWKIAASNLLYAVSTARHGMNRRKHTYAELCKRHGIGRELFWPATAAWEAVGHSTASAAK